MRINLVTPFADKDAAKALGARWDAAKKIWYIIDVADLTPFARWIPNIRAAMGNLTDEVKQSAKSSSKVKVDQFHGLTTAAVMCCLGKIACTPQSRLPHERKAHPQPHRFGHQTMGHCSLSKAR